jgi:hypothetical protein
MKPVFADSSYYLALVNPTDPRHERAVELAQPQLHSQRGRKCGKVAKYSCMSLGGKELR